LRGCDAGNSAGEFHDGVDPSGVAIGRYELEQFERHRSAKNQHANKAWALGIGDKQQESQDRETAKPI